MSKHRFYASGEIPFAWEIKPGMSKVAPAGGGREELPKAAAQACARGTPKLPPPPCPREARRILSGQLHMIPLPPCPFQTRPAGGTTWDDDPFLAAYMECTGSARDPAGRAAPPPKQQQRKKKMSKEAFGIPSCKNVRDVVEDGVVRLSRMPSGQPRRRNVEGKWRERDSSLGPLLTYP